MTANIQIPPMTPDRQRVRSRIGWSRLLATCAWATLLATVLMQVGGRFIGFPSLVVLDLAMIVGLLLLRSRHRAGVVVIGVFCLLNNLHASLFWAALQDPADFVLFLTCLTTWVTSALAVPVAFLAWRAPAPATTDRLPRLVARTLAVGLLLAAAGSLTLYATRTTETAQPGDLLLVRERPTLGLFTDAAGYEWSPAALEAPAGAITVAVTNPDPVVGGNFTIEELDVDVDIPPDTTRRITVDAPTGTYRYHDTTFLIDGILTVT
jgi:hypothetical protein